MPRSASAQPGPPRRPPIGLVLDRVARQVSREFDEYTDTLAFEIRGPRRALLYLPDIDKWEKWPTPIESVLARVDFQPSERAALAARQPHGRLVHPAEVAEAVAFLAGPSAGSTTGVDLAVDGGMAALRLRGPVSPPG